LSEKYFEFKLTDLPTNEFCVLLEPEVQKNLIETAKKRLDSYTKLAEHLKEICISLHDAKVKDSIRDYVRLWRENKKLMPLDCLWVLCHLANKDPNNIAKQTTKLKRIKGTTPIKFDKDFIDVILKHDENNLNFLSKFWNVKITEKEIRDFKDFIKSIKLKINGLKLAEIYKFGISKTKLHNWIYKGSLPKLVQLLQHYNKLNDSGENLFWLSLNQSSWRFKGPWINVPNKIEKYSDIINVIIQLKSLPIAYEKAKQLNINLENIDKGVIFGYLLGALVGDCNKDKSTKNRASKRIVLQLAKTHRSNLRFGEFVTFCANTLGLRMKRAKDRATTLFGRGKIYESYQWRSQQSPLISWLVKVCLGLEEGQTTTYDPIKTEWMLTAPKNFKIAFLQGIFDSDGWIDLNTQSVGVASGPNTKFLKDLFQTLDICGKNDKYNISLRMNCKGAYLLSVFNPYVRSYRYIKLEKFIKAKRFKHWPKWLHQKIDNYIKLGFKRIEIIEKILDEDKIAISGSSIYLKRRVLCQKTN
jgi:hypothetical protein